MTDIRLDDKQYNEDLTYFGLSLLCGKVREKN